MEYNMEPYFINQKSFYGKAKIKQSVEDGVLRFELYSYDTFIMAIEKEDAEYSIVEIADDENLFTHTTMKHVHEFLKQNRIKDMPKKKLMEVAERINEES